MNEHLTQYAKSRRDAMIVEMYTHEFKRKSRRDAMIVGFCNMYLSFYNHGIPLGFTNVFLKNNFKKITIKQ